MKRILSMLLGAAILILWFPVGFGGSWGVRGYAETVAVDRSKKWEYIRVEERADLPLDAITPPEGWLLGKDQSEEWCAATLPQGGEWTGQCFKAFLRTSFTLEDPWAWTAFYMEIGYDEDPAVYLNGERIWSATGYDTASVDLSSYCHLLKEENYLCVEYVNRYGGTLMDPALTVERTLDAQGYLIPASASCENIRVLGTINQPENILDMDGNTLCGSGFNSEAEQSVTVSYPRAYEMEEVFLRCKDEGTTTHSDGVTRGSYDLYVRQLGAWYKAAEDVQARPEGGTVKLNGRYKADAVKVVITSWQGSKWACVADLAALPAKGEQSFAGVDLEGKAVVLDACYSGFGDFGAVNDAANVLDGENDTVCGGGYDEKVRQSVTLTFGDTVRLGRVYIECKQEGAPQQGSWGSYDLYAICDGIPYKIAQQVDALPQGMDLVLDRAYDAQALMAVVTAWRGTAWAAIAELNAGQAPSSPEVGCRDVTGSPIIDRYTEELTGDYGEVNAVENMFDGRSDTMWGTNWSTQKEISVSLSFKKELAVDRIAVYAMDEQNAPERGAWGSYDVYAITAEGEILLKKGLEAWPQDYEGAPDGAGQIVLGEPVRAQGIKIVVSSWKVEQWAGIATLEIGTVLLKGDVNADDTVSISDVTALLNLLAGKMAVLDDGLVTDLDGDRSISINDVTALLNLIAGKEGL